MGLEYLNEQRGLPTINRELVKQRGQDEITDYLFRLVRCLSEDLLRIYSLTINNILHLTNVGCFYFQLPDSNGNYKDGDRRFIDVNGGVELQQMVGGVWKTGTDAIARWQY